MKKFGLFLLIALSLVIFQTSLLAPWFADYFCPDLLLVCVVSIVAIFGFQATWNWIALVGLIFDIFTYSRIGTHVIVFILSAYVISFVSRRFSIGERGLGLLLIVALMPFVTLLDFWGGPFLSGISAGRGLFSLQTFYSTVVIALENLVLFSMVYPIILRIKKQHTPFQFQMGK